MEMRNRHPGGSASPYIGMTGFIFGLFVGITAIVGKNS